MIKTTGTVQSQGTPVAGALVTFWPQDSRYGQLRSLAVTDEQGNFELKTVDQKLGAISGSHKVTVEDLAILRAPRSPDGTVTQLPPQRFSPNYSDTLKSPLLLEVKQQAEPLVFEIDLQPR